MKKIYSLAAMLAMATMAVYAQEPLRTLDTYAGAQLTTEDLNGTARYVGMGGAMEALGADISTINSNPAGIGLFRKSLLSGSLGVVMQEDGHSFHNGSTTNVSFDQLGIVFSSRTSKDSYLNFAFNFNKNRNFNYILFAEADAVNGSSQMQQTTVKGMLGTLDALRGGDKNYYGESQLDNLYWSNLLDDGNGGMYTYDGSEHYDFNRAHSGYIGEYDFNLSGNIHNRVYLGVTVGINSVHYQGYSEYYEVYNPNSHEYVKGGVLVSDDHKITGTGFNVKAGIIFRPIAESPFRVGLSVSSPTWYKLTSKNYTKLGDVDFRADDFKFRFDTPWKFGISAGHTIDNSLALGVSYEYADYSTNDMRVIDGSYYDSWDGYYHEDSSSDPEMKNHTERTLKGVSTLKLGAEYRIDKNVSVRVGYNYVSPMYNNDGVRDQNMVSPGVYTASTTDFTNWKSTNRLTAGVGFTFDNFRLDLAYQYSMRKGDFYPYMPYLSASYWAQDPNDPNSEIQEALTNECKSVSVKDNRHQLLCTMTYTF